MQPLSAKITVLGLGGLGTPAAWAIATGWTKPQQLELTLIDSDRIELSNLNRQVLYTPQSVGQEKAYALAAALDKQGIPSNIKLNPVVTRLTQDNCDQLLLGQDFVVEATDSSETKFLVNDYCYPRGISFCYAGVRATYGQMMMVNSAAYHTAPCLRCLFAGFNAQEIAAQENQCQREGIVGTVAGMLGLLQANAALAFLAEEPAQSPARTQLVKFSLESLELESVGVSCDPECSLHQQGQDHVAVDLSDQSCPMTFLYTKLALEKLPVGKSLRVTFGNEDSARSVRTNCLEEGYLVPELHKQLGQNHWQLDIIKPRR